MVLGVLNCLDFLVYYLFGMAFFYVVNSKLERYESGFHFWYVNGRHPDPKLKQEIAEKRLADETRLGYSQRDGESGGKGRSRNSWRK